MLVSGRGSTTEAAWEHEKIENNRSGFRAARRSPGVEWNDRPNNRKKKQLFQKLESLELQRNFKDGILQAILLVEDFLDFANQGTSPCNSGHYHVTAPTKPTKKQWNQQDVRL